MKLSFNMQGFTAKKASEGINVEVSPITLEVEYTADEFIALTEKQPELIAKIIELIKA